MTMLEAIKAAYDAMESVAAEHDDFVCHGPTMFTLGAAIRSAESEAKREAIAKTMAGVAWKHYRLANPGPLAEQPCKDLDAYFATGEKEG